MGDFTLQSSVSLWKSNKGALLRVENLRQTKNGLEMYITSRGRSDPQFCEWRTFHCFVLNSEMTVSSGLPWLLLPVPQPRPLSVSTRVAAVQEHPARNGYSDQVLYKPQSKSKKSTRKKSPKIQPGMVISRSGSPKHHRSLHTRQLDMRKATSITS